MPPLILFIICWKHFKFNNSVQHGATAAQLDFHGEMHSQIDMVVAFELSIQSSS